MKVVLSIAALAALTFAAPAPSTPHLKAIRQAAPKITDVDILNYALTLEHLEDKFYRDGLKNYTQADFAKAGFDATFYGVVKQMAADEATHVAFLTSALKAAGATPVQEATYSFPCTDVKSFVQLSSILEGVGVTAYLGAAAEIVSSTYLTAAGSILTIEARHSAYIRSSMGLSPLPVPFDVPLTLNEVFTLAAPLIISQPANQPSLPIKGFPTLVSSPQNGNITIGSKITLLTPGSIVKAADGKSQIYAAFITVTGPVFAPATAVDGGFTVTVPQNAQGKAPIGGATYVVLTGCNTTVTDDTVAAGPALLEVTPQ